MTRPSATPSSPAASTVPGRPWKKGALPAARPRPWRVGLLAASLGLVLPFAAPAQTLYVAENNGTVGRYNPATGAGGAFVSGFSGVLYGIAEDNNNHLYVSNYSGNSVGEFNATTGAAINASFITGLNAPGGLALNSAGTLLVDNFGTAPGTYTAAYNSTTGAVISTTFIGPDRRPAGVTIDANNNAYVMNYGNGYIGKYNALTGATINGSGYPTGSTPAPLNTVIAQGGQGIAVDKNGNLYVANSGNGTVSEYSAAGAQLTTFTLSGLNEPYGVALDNQGDLFVCEFGAGRIGEYNAATGAVINANFVTGLSGPEGLLYYTPAVVPEPSTWALTLLGLGGAGVFVSRQRRAAARA